MSEGLPTTTLILVRHGRTDWNRVGRWHGQADIPLDELGALQARAFAESVARLRPDVLVTSPLVRARQTAAAVSKALEFEAESDQRLAEVDVGDWEGLVDEEVFRQDPSFRRAPEADRRFSATGETPTECGERVAAALGDLSARFFGKRILVVSHAYAIRAGVGFLLGWDHPSTLRLAGLYNCAYAELQLRREGRWELISWNTCGVRIPGQRSGEVLVV